MEDILILRLPTRLASRLGARISRQERSRGEGFFRRRRKQKGAKNEKAATATLIDAIWGEDGVPDYDSMDEAADLLDLEGNEESGGESDEEKEENKTVSSSMDVEEEEDDDLIVDYWRVDGKDYIFRYGEDEYFATLITLPCVVEAQKTLDNTTMYKTADISQVLLVHDVKVASGNPRPHLDPNEIIDGVYVNGLTAPTYHIAERFEKVSSAARRNIGEHILSLEDVREADERLAEFKDLVIQKHKKYEAQQEKAARKNAKINPNISLTPTLFVHEEIIQAEAWMEIHPDDVIVVEQRNDNFLSSTQKEQQKARNNKYVMDDKKRQAAAAMRGGGNFPSLANPLVPSTISSSSTTKLFTSQTPTPSPPIQSSPTPPEQRQQLDASPPLLEETYPTNSPIPIATTQTTTPDANVTVARRITDLKQKIEQAQAEIIGLQNPNLKQRRLQKLQEAEAELRRLESGGGI